MCAEHECEYGKIRSPLPLQVPILDEPRGASKGKDAAVVEQATLLSLATASPNALDSQMKEVYACTHVCM